MRMASTLRLGRQGKGITVGYASAGVPPKPRSTPAPTKGGPSCPAEMQFAFAHACARHYHSHAHRVRRSAPVQCRNISNGIWKRGKIMSRKLTALALLTAAACVGTSAQAKDL